MKDLLVVVPDKTWELVMGEILKRHEALGIRPISSTIARHTYDSGVRVHGAQFAAGQSMHHGWALLIFDHEGCGDDRPAEDIEADLREQLKTHWADRADAVVVTPEIEAWLWRAKTQIAQRLGRSVADVWAKLREMGFLGTEDAKPSRPKEAFLALLREARTVPSAAIYAEIARVASLRAAGCQTESFPRFVGLLKRWFGAGGAS